MWQNAGEDWAWSIFLLVVAVVSIPFSLRMTVLFEELFNQQLLEPLAQLPTVYVQNGMASIDRPMPYLIKNKKGEVVVMVDTDDHITTFPPQYPALAVLINKRQITFKVPTPQLF